MSKSSGTLVTTNAATYIHPRFMPGYKGYVPTMKFDYAQTYGASTQKYFQDFRSKTLEQSKSNYCKGGHFPTYYSYNCDMATATRDRQWDRWLQEPRYTLTNVDYDRKEELTRFGQLASAHRVQYRDTSGEVPPVRHFILPHDSK